jgi:AraC family transcriptional regulator, transcriptional activator FtrA
MSASISGPGPTRRLTTNEDQKPPTRYEDLTVEEMTARAVMSPRTFARRFRATLGASPYHWLLQQCFLETTDEPIERLAVRCGFSSAATLRLHFRRVLRLSPRSYRTTFRSASA